MCVHSFSITHLNVNTKADLPYISPPCPFGTGWHGYGISTRPFFIPSSKSATVISAKPLTSHHWRLILSAATCSH